jgi:hypothetical protein
MSVSQQDPTVFLKHPPQAFRVERDGERDLSFQGWKLAESCVEFGGDVPRSSVPQPSRQEALLFSSARDVAEYYDRAQAQMAQAQRAQAQSMRRTCVSIYVTRGGKYVASVVRVFPVSDAAADAIVTESAGEVFRFLRDSNRGTLGRASRTAWNEACQKYPPLAPHATEHID